MTLKEKYHIKDKNKIKQFLFLSCVLMFFSLTILSFASYENLLTGHINIDIANWHMIVNNQVLNNSNSLIEDKVVLVPQTNIDSTQPTKIKAGQTGYFDIVINPNETEVSFSYKVTIDTESILPEGFTINSYSLNDGTTQTLPINKTVENNVYLSGKVKFTDVDIQKIRFFWNWADSGIMETVPYNIVVAVELKQLL